MNSSIMPVMIMGKVCGEVACIWQWSKDRYCARSQDRSIFCSEPHCSPLQYPG